MLLLQPRQLLQGRLQMRKRLQMWSRLQLLQEVNTDRFNSLSILINAYHSFDYNEHHR
jgi:hypothetical protein